MTSSSSASPSARSFAVLLHPEQKGAKRPAGEGGTSDAAAIRTLRRELGGVARGLKAPSTVIVFFSGSPTLGPRVAEAVALELPESTGLVVPAAGVLDASTEIEGQVAASGIVWSGGSAKLDVGAASLEPTRGTRLVFATRSGLPPAELEKARAGCLFGAGVEGSELWGIERGKVISASLASLVLTGQGAPVVETSSACRVVGDTFAVTEVEGNVVLALDGKPALEMLSATVGGGRQAGLVLVALEIPGSTDRSFRTLKGVDPARRALLLESAIAKGERLSFATRDPSLAKTDLAEAARRAEQHALGSAPRFALYLSCASRGRSLYREPDVDVRILRKRFPKLPIAGMHAAFEIVPWSSEGDATGSGARIQLMTGVFALFRAPS